MKLKYLSILLIVLLGAWAPLNAQKIIRVTGTVYNTANKKRTPITDTSVKIYACKTIAEAQDLQKQLDSEKVNFTLFFEEESIVEADQNGFYDVNVPDNGALVFKVGMNKSILEKVEGRRKIDVGIDDGIRISEVTVTGIRTEIKPEPKNSRLVGNIYYPYNSFVIPAHTGNSHSRLIIQPYVLNCATDDTVAYCKPLIYDGKEYHLTQDRAKRYDLTRDPLYQWIQKEPFGNHRMDIDWNDTIIVSDPNATYSCYADIVIEDYRMITYHRVFQINTCINKRPMRFLQYSFPFKQLDFMDYKERAHIEKRNSQDRVSLTFKINSDALIGNEENIENLDKIKAQLTNIVNAPGATLKEFHITGISSPEGTYYKNMHLAEMRMKRIQKEVMSIVPKYIADRVYQNPQAKVASWQEVIELLRKDRYDKEADELEKLVNKYDYRKPELNEFIHQLPYYKTLITPYLKELRQVEYRCNYEIYREPTDDEILDIYETEGLHTEYTRYEYWKLFQLIKNEKEIEMLAKKAYDESLEMNPNHPWIIAANLLATCYLKRDTFDTKILDPLIDKSIYTVNYERKHMDTNRTEIINPEAIVSNQLNMLIKAGNYQDASILAKILPEKKEFEEMKAFAWALGGYYMGGNTPEEKARVKKTFNIIKNSSPQNEVVIYLALESREGNAMAAEAIKKLPQDKALTWYFKAVVEARKGDGGFSEAMMALIQCFTLDKAFILIAQNSGEFNKDLIDSTLEMFAY